MVGQRSGRRDQQGVGLRGSVMGEGCVAATCGALEGMPRLRGRQHGVRVPHVLRLLCRGLKQLCLRWKL